MPQASPSRELLVDRAVYGVDDVARTYAYLRRNPDWRDLDPVVNDRNQRQIDGFTRVFRDGRTKVFRYRPRRPGSLGHGSTGAVATG